MKLAVGFNWDTEIDAAILQTAERAGFDAVATCRRKEKDLMEVRFKSLKGDRQQAVLHARIFRPGQSIADGCEAIACDWRVPIGAVAAAVATTPEPSRQPEWVIIVYDRPSRPTLQSLQTWRNALTDSSYQRYRQIAASLSSDDRAEIFVPGRVCLFGEHSDWACQFGLWPGNCIVVGTNQGIHAVAERCDDKFSVELAEGCQIGADLQPARSFECEFTPAALEKAACDREEFYRYMAGVAYYLRTLPTVGKGVKITITGMDLPLKKGVSSSAAVCILVARAFNRLYNLRLSVEDEMELAYLGERMTGSECGRMDQACAYGRVPVFLTFERHSVRIDPIRCGGTIHMVLVDLAGEKDTVKILSDLRRVYADPNHPACKGLRYALGERNIDIANRARIALQEGNARAVGALMTEAQEVFDRFVQPACPDQLAAPLLHKVLTLPSIQPLIWGGKGVGSQGDGTAQLVARGRLEQELIAQNIREAFPQMSCFEMTIQPALTQRPLRAVQPPTTDRGR